MHRQAGREVVQAPSSAVSDEQLVAMLIDRARNDGLQLTGRSHLIDGCLTETGLTIKPA
ncbi:hypothetical protein [Streptomyces sp. NPDC088254]|uniref:hypothetical protein n=1 Tax=Streptomyces sp. NPDC088254 TaxID=3365847 RepID=UPI00381AF816